MSDDLSMKALEGLVLRPREGVAGGRAATWSCTATATWDEMKAVLAGNRAR
jgi:hypothetical protein